MGCNCKKKYDVMKKYSDEGNTDDENKLSTSQKLAKIPMQIMFGILCGAVIIVALVPMLIYVIGCLMLGKQPEFKIKRFKKK